MSRWSLLLRFASPAIRQIRHRILLVRSRFDPERERKAGFAQVCTSPAKVSVTTQPQGCGAHSKWQRTCRRGSESFRVITIHPGGRWAGLNRRLITLAGRQIRRARAPALDSREEAKEGIQILIQLESSAPGPDHAVTCDCDRMDWVSAQLRSSEARSVVGCRDLNAGLLPIRWIMSTEPEDQPAGRQSLRRISRGGAARRRRRAGFPPGGAHRRSSPSVDGRPA